MDVFSMLYLVVSKYTNGNFTNTDQTGPGVQLIGFEHRSPELKSLFIKASTIFFTSCLPIRLLLFLTRTLTADSSLFLLYIKPISLRQSDCQM
jgi:hypothetical protein